MIPKFRAWSSKTAVLSEVINIDFRERKLKVSHWEYGDSIYLPLGEVELMQSTGLKDKNGVEIFEGDIVKLSVNNGFDYLEDEVCDVRQSRFHSGLVCNNPNNDMEYRIFNQEVLGDYQYEVIGNVWENAELLEVAE